MRLWCEWAWLGGPQAEAGVVLEVEGERITAVTTGIDRPPAGAERLAGLTLPGLVNAHSHAFHRALRSRTQAGRGSFWTWRDQMYRLAAALTPDAYRRLATATFAEMALAGITTVGEFHYLHHAAGGTPYAEPNAMGAALIEAAAAAGIRLTLLDTCYLHGGIGQRPNDVQRRFSDGTAKEWAERAGGAGAVDHRAHRCRGALRPGGRAGRDGRRGRLGLRAPLASPCPRQRAAGGERGLSGRLRPYPGRAAARCRPGGRPVHRRSRHASDRRRHQRARPGERVLLPDDRAGPG